MGLLSSGGKESQVAAGDMYKTWVNKGSINMNALARTLNTEWQQGWALHSIFEQAGNTIVIYQRRA